MNDNKLERITKIIEYTNEVNTRIAEIEVIAKIAADKLVKSEFELRINDLTEKREVSKFMDGGESFVLPKFDVSDMLSSFMGNRERLFPKPMNWSLRSDVPFSEKYDKTLKYQITNETVLRILASLLQKAQEEKTHYLKQLSKLGVNV